MLIEIGLILFGLLMVAGGVLNLIPGKLTETGPSRIAMGLFGTVLGGASLLIGIYALTIPPIEKPERPPALTAEELEGLWFCLPPGDLVANTDSAISLIHLSKQRAWKGTYKAHLAESSNGSLSIGVILEEVSSLDGPYVTKVYQRDSGFYHFFSMGSFEAQVKLGNDSLTTIETVPASSFRDSTSVERKYKRAADPESLLVELANYFLENHSPAKALRWVDQVIASNPDCWALYEIRSAIHDKQGKFTLAIQDLEKAVALAKTDRRVPPGHIRLLQSGVGQLKDMTGDFEGAIEAFNLALQTQGAPSDGVVLSDRGLAYKHAGKLTLALKDYDAAIEQQPEYDTAYMRRSWLRATSWDPSIRNGELAQTDAETVLRLASERTGTLVSLLAAAKAAQGDFKAAVTLQREAISLDPSDRELPKMLEAFENQKPWQELPAQ